MVTSGEDSGVGFAAKWVSVNNGYIWKRAWGGPGYQVGVSNDETPGRANCYHEIRTNISNAVVNRQNEYSVKLTQALVIIVPRNSLRPDWALIGSKSLPKTMLCHTTMDNYILRKVTAK